MATHNNIRTCEVPLHVHPIWLRLPPIAPGHRTGKGLQVLLQGNEPRDRAGSPPPPVLPQHAPDQRVPGVREGFHPGKPDVPIPAGLRPAGAAAATPEP